MFILHPYKLLIQNAANLHMFMKMKIVVDPNPSSKLLIRIGRKKLENRTNRFGRNILWIERVV